jgi:hypothetical protein
MPTPTTPPATLPNPRVGDLQTALSQMKGLLPPLDSRFTAAIAAMRAGAWNTSGGGANAASDQFMIALLANQTKATKTGSDGVAAINAAIGSTPATVPNPAAKKPVH